MSERFINASENPPQLSEIPQDLQDSMLVRTNHRCCICQEEGVQIHHINGRSVPDPHAEGNLIPLCPTCHSKVEKRGGSTKLYSATQLRMYKERWFAEVSSRIARMSSTRMDPGASTVTSPDDDNLWLVRQALKGLDITDNTPMKNDIAIRKSYGLLLMIHKALNEGQPVQAVLQKELHRNLVIVKEMKAYGRINAYKAQIVELTERCQNRSL